MLDDAQLAELERQIEEIDDAVAFAEAAEVEPVENLTRYVYSDRAQHDRPGARGGPHPDLPGSTARGALRDALSRDHRVFLMGEDVGTATGAASVSAWACWRSLAASASGTRPCRSQRSWVLASVPPWAECGPSSRS